ncbi:MAG TPA: TonB-dependent receptor, partial [Treponemataceae bacterium]|nr:TonB-dependent receptor [Treponemataceae bacterium]
DSTNLGKGIFAIEGALWAGVEISPLPSVLISPSFRLVLTKAEIVPVPKIGLALFAQNGFTLKTNVFRVYKNPNFNDLYWTADIMAAGNPDLKPEHGYGADFIISKEVPGIFSVEGTLFFARHKDAIIWNPDGSVWKPMNVGEALYAGADLQGELSLPYSFSVSLSYSFLQTWLLTNKLNFSDNRRMPYIPLHKGNASLAWKNKNTAVTVSSQFIGSRFTSTDNLTSLPRIVTFDAGLSQIVRDRFTCYIEVKNLSRAKVVLIDGYPLPEMTITLGARYTLQ